ncbi:unnamed protein product [Bursaphelenchus okinawaensis]|uniref:G_PROTEIN_RECEP_F1_2 domain-containing protein n=1 Tax=Bursaphelenchus okinawaensis TaxID=465554 RepID=A0A811KT21_9BILA|nr:unnamed protein product [Bursaphelenchus okinawaensis]CAG9112196.1 unnamed protein product [Bursaphelenchus okinawaensis]
MGVYVSEKDVPSDELLRFYWIYKNFTITVTIIMVFFTIFVMVTSTTRNISKYRWYIVHSLLWSLFSDIMGYLVGPVLLFPFSCYFSVNSIIQTDLQKIVFLIVGVTAMLGKNISVMFQFEHLYVKSQSVVSVYQKWFGDVPVRIEVLARGAMLVVVFVGIEVPLIFALPNQPQQLKIYSNQDRVISYLAQKYPSMTCVSSTPNISKPMMPTFLLMNMIAIIFSAMLFHMHLSIRRNSLNVQTYRLQMMLFWSLAAQMAAMYLLIILPFIFGIAWILLGVARSPTLAVICFCFFFLHTSVNCLLVLYFIKPYRDFIKGHIPAFRRESGITRSVTPMASIMARPYPSKV